MLYPLYLLFRTIFALLIICTMIELVLGKIRYPVMSRLRGAFFTLLMPITGLFIGVWLQEITGMPAVISMVGWPAWVSILALLLLRDFFNYWEHRVEHVLLWPIHSVHHAETELQAANDYSHPLAAISEILLIVVPMMLIDTGGVAIPTVIALAATMRSKLNHSPLRVHFGPFWRIMVDHRFHRIHHSIETRHFGKNFGTIFTFWDQIFGTAYFPRKDEWPDVGLVDRSRAETLTDFLAWPFKGQQIVTPCHLPDGAMPCTTDSSDCDPPPARPSPGRWTPASTPSPSSTSPAH